MRKRGRFADQSSRGLTVQDLQLGVRAVGSRSNGAMDERGNKNAALAECLAELGWAPTTLARKINRLFGAGTVSLSAPYHWLNKGGTPRAPLPTLAAYVLSQHLGR